MSRMADMDVPDALDAAADGNANAGDAALDAAQAPAVDPEQLTPAQRQALQDYLDRMRLSLTAWCGHPPGPPPAPEPEPAPEPAPAPAPAPAPEPPPPPSAHRHPG